MGFEILSTITIIIIAVVIYKIITLKGDNELDEFDEP